MSTAAMRVAIYGAYSSASWKARVNSMSDNQVVAIYMRLKSKNKI